MRQVCKNFLCLSFALIFCITFWFDMAAINFQPVLETGQAGGLLPIPGDTRISRRAPRIALPRMVASRVSTLSSLLGEIASPHKPLIYGSASLRYYYFERMICGYASAPDYVDTERNPTRQAFLFESFQIEIDRIDADEAAVYTTQALQKNHLIEMPERVLLI